MDPYVAGALALGEKIAGAIEAEAELDLYLAQQDPEYMTIVIEERKARKLFWKPLSDLILKLIEGRTDIPTG